MSTESILKRTALIDQYGNPVTVDPHGGKYPVEVQNTEANRLLENINLQLEELKNITNGTYQPSFQRNGGVNLVGADTISRAYITPDLPGGAIGTYPRSAFVNAVGWYGLGTSITVGGGVVNTGTTVFSFRNAGPKLVVVTRIYTIGICTVGFTAGTTAFGIYLLHARSWLTNDTGGASLLPLGLSLRKRGTYLPTSIGDIRIPFGGYMTAGTRVTDATSAGAISGAVSTVAGSCWPPFALYDHGDQTHAPYVYAPNEGFVLTTQAATPAAGTMTIGISIDWFETDNW